MGWEINKIYHQYTSNVIMKKIFSNFMYNTGLNGERKVGTFEKVLVVTGVFIILMVLLLS